MSMLRGHGGRFEIKIYGKFASMDKVKCVQFFKGESREQKWKKTMAIDYGTADRVYDGKWNITIIHFMPY